MLGPVGKSQVSQAFCSQEAQGLNRETLQSYFPGQRINNFPGSVLAYLHAWCV